MFRALLREQEDLAWAPDPTAVVEMAVVRLATTASGEDVQALLARLDALERRLAGGGPPGDGGETPSRSEPPPRGSAPRDRGRSAHPAEPGGAAAAPPPEAPRSVRAGDTAEDTTADEVATATAEPGTPAADAGEAGSAAGSSLEAGASLAVVLDRVRAVLGDSDRGLAAALDGATLLEWSDRQLRIAVPEAFAARRLERRQADLEAVCSRLFGRSLRVVVSGPDAPAAPPVERSEADEEHLRRRRREALDHPAVNAALEILGGEVLEIRPLGTGGPATGGEPR
jgi:DNA polymerase-3 subunit gamma/tau